MRQVLLAVAVLTMCPTTSLAQDAARQPFVVAQVAFATETETLDGLGNRFGFDTTIGFRAWRDVQLFAQGGRLIDVMPAPLLPDPERLVRFQPGRARQTSTWYGAAGARYFLPSVWRLHLYGETSAGVARMSSEIQPPNSTNGTAEGLFRVNNVVPLAALAAGVQLQLWRGFTVDTGYRAQRFFGEADTMRKEPYVAFGLRF